MAIITGFEKKGPIIYCMTENEGKAYQFDMSSGVVIGLANKPLKSMKSLETALNQGEWQRLFEASSLYAKAIRFFCNHSSYYGDTRYTSVVESLLSYADLLPEYIAYTLVSDIIHDHNGKLPKGYIKWCRDNSKMIDHESLCSFTQWQAITDWPQDLKDTIQKMSDGMNIDILGTVKGNKDLARFLVRVTHNSLKRYEISDLDYILRKLISIWHCTPELRPYFDDTKSAQVALEIIAQAQETERNNIILRREAQIASLHGTVINDLMVFVPSKMEDFTDEGNQQHNCVGHFYHDSIAAGRNLIYFLRKATSPDKSYITCRYSIQNKYTVEHRLCDNKNVGRGPIITEVDRLINNILS